MTSSLPSIKRHHVGWSILWASVVVVGIALTVLQSTVYVFGAVDDDQLMVWMAKGFLAGHWSSVWAVSGVQTLAKPVGYPLFLAGSHYLPWSPPLTNYLFYLLGVILIAWSWLRISQSPLQTTLVLVVLTLNPILFASVNQRIYRDTFTDSLATLAIGLAFVLAARSLEPLRPAPAGAVVADLHGGHERRRWTGYVVTLVLSLAIGLVIGALVITRESSLWIPTALAAPLAYPAILKFKAAAHRWTLLGRAALAGLVLVAALGGVVEFTKDMNRRTYGVSLIDDLSSGGLVRTWKAWASVEAGPSEPHVVITEPMRQAVYRVSPAAARMKPFLESPKDAWKGIDCESILKICNDSGPWFEWDIQSAAANAGQIDSVRSLQTYFNTVADQIEAACNDGQLTCTSSPVLGPGVPPLDRIPLAAVATGTAQGLRQALWSSLSFGVPAAARPSPAVYETWAAVVPAMPPIQSTTTSSSPGALYPILRWISYLYRALTAVLAAILVLGVLIWLVSVVARRPRASRWPKGYAVSIAALFFLTSAIGMALLAVFNTVQIPLYLIPGYWTDFATATQLFVVFGAIAAWPLLADGLARLRRGGHHAPGTATHNRERADEPTIDATPVPVPERR